MSDTRSHDLPVAVIADKPKYQWVIPAIVTFGLLAGVLAIVAWAAKPTHQTVDSIEILIRYPQGKIDEETIVKSDVGKIGEVTKITPQPLGILVTVALYENTPKGVTVEDALPFVRDVDIRNQPPFGVQALHLGHLMIKADLYILRGSSSNKVKRLTALDHQPLKYENGHRVKFTAKEASKLSLPFPILGDNGVLIGQAFWAQDHGKTVDFEALIYRTAPAEYLYSSTLYYTPEEGLEWGGGTMVNLHALEVLLGKSYVRAYLDGPAERSDHFTVADEVPVVVRAKDPVRFRCFSKSCGSIQKWSKVLFRGTEIGEVAADPQPTEDGTKVWFPFWVEREYSHLICENTVLADCGGLGAHLPGIIDALRGEGEVTARAPTVVATVNGGLAVFPRRAPESGKILDEGADVWMLPEVPSYLREEFSSHVSLNRNVADELQNHSGNYRVHKLYRAYVADVFGNRAGRGARQSRGYGFVVDGYLLAPSDLVGLPSEKLNDGDPVRFTMDGHSADLSKVAWSGSSLRTVRVNGTQGWPRERIAQPNAVDDLYVATYLDYPLFVLPAGNLKRQSSDRWNVTGNLPLHPSWHGVPVFDGNANLVGLLLRQDMGSYKRWSVALVGSAFSKSS